MKRPEFEHRGAISWRASLRIGAMFVFFACCNFVFGYFASLTNPTYAIKVVVCTLLGMIWAQAGLLSAGVTLFASALWLRLTLHWFSAYLLTAAMLGGIAVADSEAIAIWDVLATMLTLPILVSAIQAPLWATRSFLHWRIAGESIIDDPNKLSLRVADLFVATAVLSVSLGAARVASHDNPFYWTELAIALPIAALLSLLSIVPATFFLLRSESLRFGLLAWTGYTIAASVLPLAYSILVLWQSDTRAFDLFSAAQESALGMCCIFSTGLALACGLLTVRCLGFQLRHGRPGATSVGPSIDEESAAPPAE